MEPITLSIELSKDQNEALATLRQFAGEITELTISTDQQNQNASELLKRIKSDAKTVEDMRTTITKPMLGAKKMVDDYFRPLSETLGTAEVIIKRAILKFLQEQEAIRVAAQRKALAEAEAEEVRKRKLLEAQAVKAEEKGNDVRAETLREKAEMVHVPVQVFAPSVTKVSGISTRKKWVFEIIDESLIPREYLKVDEDRIRKYVNAMEEKAEISGVKITSEQILAAGRV
jgi:hypothetical protein